MNAFARRIGPRLVPRRVRVFFAIYLGAAVIVLAARHLVHP